MNRTLGMALGITLTLIGVFAILFTSIYAVVSYPTYNQAAAYFAMLENTRYFGLIALCGILATIIGMYICSAYSRLRRW